MKKLLILSGLMMLTACGGSDEKNEAPEFGVNFFVTETDKAIMDFIRAFDKNRDPLTFQVVSQPTRGTLSLNSSGTFTYTPAAEFTGNDTFQISVSDGEFTVNGTVNVEVRVANVSFLNYSRQAFMQSASDAPLRVNGRNFVQDAMTEQDYADLLNNP